MRAGLNDRLPHGTQGGIGLCMILFLGCVPVFVNAQESVLSLQRMGAGAPGGWRVEKEHCNWHAEQEPGPLGVGAARFQFPGPGYIELRSPGQFLKRDAQYAVALYVRSEPPGGKIELSLHDNDREDERFLGDSFIARESWQRVICQGVLKKSLKERYFLKVRISGEACSVWADGLWLGEVTQPVTEEWRPAYYSASVVLEPEAAWGVVTGNEPLRIKATVSGAWPSGSRLRFQAFHTNGQTAELPALSLPAVELWQENFAVTGDIGCPFGMLRVEAVLADPEGKALSPKSETLLAHVPEPLPGPMPDSPFGVHVKLREPDLAAVAKLGYKWCRIHDADASTKWGVAEPEPGKWVWFDEKLSLPKKHGLCVLGMLDGAPAWESGDTDSGYWSIYHAPKDIAHWKNYVRAMAGHYRGMIDAWEVWNEPWDLFRFFQAGSPPLYCKLLKAACEEAKQVNPECTIAGLDTYPPFWEAAVLSFGAYPYYDTASWHRYDPNLQGRPNDSIARVTARINNEQSKYGPPRPLFCSEGGIDVTMFHGSFFSFADPAIMGDWRRGADAYARMYLGIMASGNTRFISYSMHEQPRHGTATHMMVEPGFLMRPMHSALAALAHFVDGASFVERLAPAHDITAMVFHHNQDRPFAPAPATVVALFANGEDPEELPRSLPATLQCFDRFGNPVAPPENATRSPVYLVAGDHEGSALMEALRSVPETIPATPPAVDQLLEDTCAALAKNTPALWTLFSSQTAALLLPQAGKTAVFTRASLKSLGGGGAPFPFPANLQVIRKTIQPAGCFSVGAFDLADGREQWRAVFGAVQDGPGHSWRYTALTLIPQGAAPEPEKAHAVDAVLRVWEQCFLKARTEALYDTFRPTPCSVAAATMNGEYFTFDRFDYLVTMLNTAVLWGPAAKSVMKIEECPLQQDVAAVRGVWKFSSLAFGIGDFPFTASLVQEQNEWKLAALCIGPAAP